MNAAAASAQDRLLPLLEWRAVLQTPATSRNLLRRHCRQHRRHQLVVAEYNENNNEEGNNNAVIRKLPATVTTLKCWCVAAAYCHASSGIKTEKHLQQPKLKATRTHTHTYAGMLSRVCA